MVHTLFCLFLAPGKHLLDYDYIFYTFFFLLAGDVNI